MNQALQIARLSKNLCVECGGKTDGRIYVNYPTCCRDCAKKEMRK